MLAQSLEHCRAILSARPFSIYASFSNSHFFNINLRPNLFGWIQQRPNCVVVEIHVILQVAIVLIGNHRIVGVQHRLHFFVGIMHHRNASTRYDSAINININSNASKLQWNSTSVSYLHLHRRLFCVQENCVQLPMVRNLLLFTIENGHFSLNTAYQQGSFKLNDYHHFNRNTSRLIGLLLK